MQQTMLAPLGAPEARDARRFGNKAANLATACLAGLPVPRGLVIAHDAIDNELAINSIVDALRLPVAVRSSSVAEDAVDRAFPGVFDTVLGVETRDQLISAVARVVASGSGERLRAYLATEAECAAAMAVLVQELVPAAIAGVAFTRDPVSGESVIVVESTLGLGAPVVDGEVTPDCHELTPSLRVASRKLGRKSVRLDFDCGLSKRMVEKSASARFALSDDQARAVGQLALDAEQALGAAVDIEWAIDHENRLWLLQARPITTTPKKGTNE